MTPWRARGSPAAGAAVSYSTACMRNQASNTSPPTHARVVTAPSAIISTPSGLPNSSERVLGAAASGLEPRWAVSADAIWQVPWGPWARLETPVVTKSSRDTQMGERHRAKIAQMEVMPAADRDNDGETPVPDPAEEWRSWSATGGDCAGQARILHVRDCSSWASVGGIAQLATRAK